MQVVVNHLLTNYKQSGYGKQTVLFLHGWGDNLSTFSELQSSLSKDYECVSLDLPGFGSTQAPPEAWSLDNYAEFLTEFLQKVHAKKIHAIVAHSNGAALAIRALALDKIKADKLILVGAAGIRDKNSLRKLALKTVAKTGKAATFWLPESSKKKLRKKLYGVSGSDLLVVPHMQETFKLTVKQDVQADAAKLDVATLLIYGANDRATPQQYGQIYNRLIKNSKLEILENAEHHVHQDQPETVIKLIEDFLK